MMKRSASLRWTRAGRARSAMIGIALAAALLLPLVSFQGMLARAESPAGLSLTGEDVVAALGAAGLEVEDLELQPIGGSPTGPPATEREALGFTVTGQDPFSGRILVFADDDGLRQKAAWFRRAGATVFVHRNVILWLDPAMEPSLAGRYHAALQTIRQVTP